VKVGPDWAVDDPCGSPVECYSLAIQSLEETEQEILEIPTRLSDLNRTVITNQNLVLTNQKELSQSILELSANVSANGRAINSNINAIAANKNAIAANNENISSNAKKMTTLKVYPCNCTTTAPTPTPGTNYTLASNGAIYYWCMLCVGQEVVDPSSAVLKHSGTVDEGINPLHKSGVDAILPPEIAHSPVVNHSRAAQQQTKDDPCGTPVECYAQAYQALEEAEQKASAIQARLLDLNRTGVITNKNLVLAYQKQVNESILRLKANVSANGQAISSNTHAIAMNKDAITASNSSISANSLRLSTLVAYPCRCRSPLKPGSMCTMIWNNTYGCCDLCMSMAVAATKPVGQADTAEEVIIRVEKATVSLPLVGERAPMDSYQSNHALRLKDDPCSTPVECYEQAIEANKEVEQKILAIQTGLSDLNYTVIANKNEALAGQKQVNATILGLKTNVSANVQPIGNNTNALTANKNAIATSKQSIGSNSRRLSTLSVYPYNCLRPIPGINCTVTDEGCCKLCVHGVAAEATDPSA
jgi:homoserine dehydrogenase